MRQRRTPCPTCRGSGRAGIGGRLTCYFCTGAGIERLSIWQAGYWIDLALAAEGGSWRLRVVGRERASLAAVTVRWHVLGLDLLLGRSKETWTCFEAARCVAQNVVRELRAQSR